MKILQQRLWFFLVVALVLNLGLWLQTRHFQSRWINVPPPPGVFAAASAGLGDLSFAYRFYAIMLQNLGDFGGRTTSLNEYNYMYIGSWLEILNKFDSRSDYLPFLASYYFGGVQDPAKLRPVIDYLAKVGDTSQGEKWRWLAQAAYLARFRMEDMDLALSLARKLSELDNPSIPGWARQMPANVLNARGEKEAAYEMLIGILKNDAERLKPNEVNATVAYICEQVLTPDQAKINSLCQVKH